MLQPSDYDWESKHKGINGRYEYFVDMAHPLSDVNGRVYVHRHLASVKLGRWLLPVEHVHHIDGDAMNNEMINLVVVTGSEHAKLHRRASGCEAPRCRQCDQCGKSFTARSHIAKFCSQECSHVSQRKVKERPVEEVLLSDIEALGSFVAVGKKYGVTDNAIRKWLGLKK